MSLAEAELEQFSYGFICHPEVLFRFVLHIYNSYFPTFSELAPSCFNYATSVPPFEAFSRIQGLFKYWLSPHSIYNIFWTYAS